MLDFMGQKIILNRISGAIRAFVPRHIICALSQYVKSETEVHGLQLIMLLTVSACRPDIRLHWQHVYFNSSSSVNNHQETKRTQPPEYTSHLNANKDFEQPSG